MSPLRKMVLNTYSFVASLWIVTWVKKVNIMYFFHHMMWYMYMAHFSLKFSFTVNQEKLCLREETCLQEPKEKRLKTFAMEVLSAAVHVTSQDCT